VGLKSDGSIVAWGLNTDGQCTVPAPNTGFLAVGAVAFHSLGLKADPCYPNFDASTAVPTLNVADFTCFLQRFAAGCP
jgi:alpha-tubulin suppressor-like RCC1 family protein